MKYFKLTWMAWGLSLMMLASVRIGHAQEETWSAWETIADGHSDLLQIRTTVKPDSNMATGYRMKYEITNQYANPVFFTVTFRMPILNPADQTLTNYTESYSYHVAANTSVLGRLDTQTLIETTAAGLTIHSSDPDPESEEAAHGQTEEEAHEDPPPDP